MPHLLGISTIEDGDGYIGVFTDLCVNFTIDMSSYMVAGWAGAKVTGALGTAVAPGVGTLVGAGAGFVVGVALYTATDVVTINDYTLREHAQYTLDEGVEDLKKWITDNIPLGDCETR